MPDLVALTLIMAIQAAGALYIARGPAAGAGRRGRALLAGGLLLSYAVLCFGFLLRFYRVAQFFPQWWWTWGRGLVILYALLSIVFLAALIAARTLARVRPGHSPTRRRFLKTAQGAMFAAPAVATGYGIFIQRFDLRMREQNIYIPGLAPDLDGLRLAQKIGRAHV